MNFKKFMRNSKAISPIFATLILIAIAVIAGVVVYMFTSGTLATMTGGGTAAQEKVSMQAIQGVASTKTVTIYAQATSGSTVYMDSAILKDASGNVMGTANVFTGGSGTNNNGVGATLTTLQCAITLSGSGTMTASNSYTITLVSTKGGNFVSPSFVAT